MELSINNPDEGLIIGDKQPVPGTVPFHPGVVVTGSPGRRKIQVATGHHDRCFSGASIRLMDSSTLCRPRAGIKSLWPRFRIGSLSRGNTKSCSLRALASGFDGWTIPCNCDRKHTWRRRARLSGRQAKVQV